MQMIELVTRCRSYRRFRQEEPVDHETLLELVELARRSPSSANQQALKFMLSSDPRQNALIFPYLAWAGYLKDWPGPAEGERPAAYILILGDLLIRESFSCDHGIAAQSILLGAAERGLGGCIIGAIQRDALRDTLKIPERFQILLVLALGRPGETVMLEAIGEEGDHRYWRDGDGRHHVPKRSLDELVYSPVN